jgi:hypothetical protein
LYARSATAALRLRLPSSKNPVFVRASVSVAWAAASPSSNRLFVLRFEMVSPGWW